MSIATTEERGVTRYQITIRGIVQGVGFRPFVYRLANSLALTGSVANTGAQVDIAVEGDRARLDAFVKRLTAEAPVHAQIVDVRVDEGLPVGETAFTIRESAVQVGGQVYLSPDIAICDDCHRELFDPNDRRYRYPFINCTNCGPRLTIITGVPYDRPSTTMRDFALCPDCAHEYHDPADRRFHAQPIACPVCGPQVTLLQKDGTNRVTGEQAIAQTRALLADGKILAIKGLGGYHLACNALDGEAVCRLRQRKHRDERPFAVMAADIATAVQYCDLSELERATLQSPASPIVLLRKHAEFRLPDEIAPGNPDLGVMLPYTPLHALLLHDSPTTLLVMTSGNISGEPICFQDDEALATLGDIADAVLLHDREIHTRVDDSVTRIIRGQEYPLRRSRGYVPLPVTVRAAGRRSVLACGAQLKNTFCLNRGEEYYLSHHIGDLENYETFTAYEHGIALFKQLLGVTPEVIAYDLHPDYLSTQFARAQTLPQIGVQHHQAHVAACLAEHNIDGEVIGVAFDGTGYGDDGNMWGGEFFVGGLRGLTRIAHLEYVTLPGGDAAIKAPWKIALGYLAQAYGTDLDTMGILADAPHKQFPLVREVLAKGYHVYRTSSAGRLFDAVAAIAGVRTTASFEGQAAMALEYCCQRVDGALGTPYPFMLAAENGQLVVGTRDIIRAVVAQTRDGVSPTVIAGNFHETMAQVILAVCQQTRHNTGLTRVALSGGVFQNCTLLLRTLALLEAAGFTPYIHQRVPANDGGLALGQAVLAALRGKEGLSCA